MKKMLMCATALSLVAGFAFSAHAECDGPYLAARGGIVKYNIDGQVGGHDTKDLEKKERLMLSGALGYRYEYFRTELEYVWRKHTEHEVDYVAERYKTYSYMLNFYYDLMPYNWWTPFVGAGAGLTKLSYSSIDTLFPGGRSEGAYKPMKFTWSVGAGLSLKVTNRFNIDAGYRYYDMGKLKEAEVKAHEIYGGLRYVF